MATITSLGFDIFSHWDGSGVREARNDIEMLNHDVNSLNDQTIHVRTIVDDGEARARIAALRAEMHSIGDRTVHIDVDVDQGRTNVSNLRHDVTDLNSSFARAAGQSGMGLLTTAAVALGPALVPIGAALLGIGAAAGAMGVSAAAGLGLYAAVTMGAVKSTMQLRESIQTTHQNLDKQRQVLSQLTPGTAAYDAQLRRVNQTQAQYSQLLSSMSLPQQLFIEYLDNMSAAWKKLIHDTMSWTLLPVINVMFGITVAIGKLKPLITDLAKEFNTLALKMTGWLGGTGFENFLHLVRATGVPIIHNLIQAAESLTHVFGDFFRVFASQGVVFSKVLADGAASLAKWADGGGFARFLETVKRHAPMVGEFFKALIEALGHVSAAISDLGPLSLGLATIFLKLVAALPPVVIQTLALAFVAVRSAMMGMAIIEVVVTAMRVLNGLCLGTRLGLLGLAIAESAHSIAAGIAAAAQWVLNASFYGCPVVWIIGAILLIVGAIILIATKTTWFQTAWTATWGAIRTAAEAVWGALQTAFHTFIHALVTAWDTVSGPLKTAWNAVWGTIKDFAHGVWLSIQQAWHLLVAIFGPVWDAVSGPLKAVWSGTWTAIKAVAEPIWNSLKLVWAGFVLIFGALWNVASAAFRGAWNILWTAVKTIATGVWDALKLAWSVFIGALKIIWDTVGGPLKAAWNLVWTAIRTVVMAFVNEFKIVWRAFVENGILGVWNTVSGQLKAAWNTLWNGIKAVAEAVWNALKAAWQAFWNAIRDTYDKVSSALKSAWETLWKAIKTAAEDVWNALKAAWESFWNAIQDTYDKVSSALKSAWETFWKGIKQVADDIWKALQKGWDDLSEGVQKTLKTLVSKAKDIWDGIVSIFKAPVNLVIGIWDHVAGAIGLPQIAKLADGGEVRGPGTSTSDSIPALLSDGEYVMNARSVQHYGLDTMHSINARKYADGGSVGGGSLNVKPITPGTSGQIGGQPGVDVGTVENLRAADSKGITNTIGSFSIFDPLGIASKLVGIAATVVYDIVKPILDKAVNMVPDPIPGVLKPAGSVPHAAVKTIADGVLAKLKSAQDQAKAAASAGPSGPAPPGTVRDWIVSGLGLVGQGSNQPWINGLYTIAMRESGGNPHAINLTDSNAAAGHPSKGLLQFIDSTFNAYAIPGHHDIWNPVDQVAADWGYIRATYGDISNVQQANSSLPPKGYRNGTQSAMSGWHVVGEAGPEFVEFGGGEKVKSFKDIIAEIKAAASSEGASTLHAKLAEVLAELSERTGVNISVPITANGGNANEVVSKIEAELIPKLRMMMQQHVGRRSH